MAVTDIRAGADAAARPRRVFPVGAAAADQAGRVVVAITMVAVRAGTGATYGTARVFPVGPGAACRPQGLSSLSRARAPVEANRASTVPAMIILFEVFMVFSFDACVPMRYVVLVSGATVKPLYASG